jgi:hypothetical protein
MTLPFFPRRRLLTVIVIERDDETGEFYGQAMIAEPTEFTEQEGPRATIGGAVHSTLRRITDHPNFPRFGKA